MAVPKNFNFNWETAEWSSTVANSTLFSSAVTDYVRDERAYYNEFIYIYGIEEKKNLEKQIQTYVESNITNDFNKQYRYVMDEKDPLQVVTFDPENLWSEPKCLKTDIVQNAEQKSRLGITSQTKISELKKEK